MPVRVIHASGVAILQTSYASFHTNTVRNAFAKGTRVLEMWGFEEETMVVGGAKVDYEEMVMKDGRLLI